MDDVGYGCPACGNIIDFCPGHGEIGDPEGQRILEQHDAGEHEECHPRAECGEDCHACGGDGYVDDPDDGTGHRTVDCPACDGSGKEAVK